MGTQIIDLHGNILKPHAVQMQEGRYWGLLYVMSIPVWCRVSIVSKPGIWGYEATENAAKFGMLYTISLRECGII